jgi:hypothetical protein
MDNLSDIYNKGFLPGPKETKESFFYRIQRIEKLIKSPPPFFKKKLMPFYGCGLLEIGSKNLFFHGSSTCIYQVEKGVNLPIISTPSKFSKLFVTEKEIFDHELIHARRCQFEKSKYEEILAYRTSNCFIRKMISPIFNSNTDVILFFLGIFSLFISFIPLFLVLIFLSTRLFLRQKAINRCIKHLKNHTCFYENILHSMTDEEIDFLSKGQIDKIDFSLYRWQLLKNIFYFNVL